MLKEGVIVMTKHEHNIETLCTCYTLDYLVMQAEKLRSGEMMETIGGEIGISEVVPNVTIEDMDEAIAHYNDEEYRKYRDDWWCNTDEEYDIQTLCICYPLEVLIEQRDKVYSGISMMTGNSDVHEVLYTADINTLEKAIACYNEEKYQKVRRKMKEEWKQYGII